MLLLFSQHAAWADLWAYVDERGITHFAAEQVDERYALFFRGREFNSARDGGAAAASAAASGPARLQTYFDIAPGYKSVRHHLRAAAERYGVEVELLQAVIATESGFDAAAVSPRGAVGLMQLMPATAERFGVPMPSAPPPSGSSIRPPMWRPAHATCATCWTCSKAAWTWRWPPTTLARAPCSAQASASRPTAKRRTT